VRSGWAIAWLLIISSAKGKRNKVSKKLLTTAIVGGSMLAGIGYYLSIRKTTAHLEVIPSASVHAINLNGLTLRLDLELKNPSANSFSIKFPYLKLLFKGALIGTSQVLNKDITIPAYGQTRIEKIFVNVPLAGLFNVASSLIKSIQSKEAVVINATMITTINTGFVNIPFQEDHELTIKK
jgi:hypothetical protein